MQLNKGEIMKELYSKFKKPPQDALKEIGAGRLKGMTDINPQWRIECLTEMFGLCGKGWYVKTISQDVIPGADGESMVKVDIELYYKTDLGEWSMPIQASGGSMFVAKEKTGLHTSDESFKMAYTDALSVACKMIGIASDVYRGVFNTKYQNDTSDSGRVDFDSLSTKEDFTKAIHNCSSVKQLNALYYKWKDKDFAKEIKKISDARKLQLENPDLKVEQPTTQNMDEDYIPY